MKESLKRLVYPFYWFAKQALPLTYRTRYSIRGVKHFTVWRMWLGRCFGIDDCIVSRTRHKA